MGEFDLAIRAPTGRVLFYPCAGRDTADALDAFGAVFDSFVFVDLYYQFKNFDVEPPPGWVEEAGSVKLVGRPVDDIRSEERSDGVRIRHIEPGWRRSSYVHELSGRRVEVVFRRGFGQYALREQQDDSLGLFMHRGDSSGEGGSNVTYLGNRKTSHEPLSRLMEVVKRKLSDPGFILSDGSNTSIKWLKRAAAGDESFSGFFAHGLQWSRVGCLNNRRGHREKSVLWAVSQAPCEVSK